METFQEFARDIDDPAVKMGVNMFTQELAQLREKYNKFAKTANNPAHAKTYNTVLSQIEKTLRQVG